VKGFASNNGSEKGTKGGGRVSLKEWEEGGGITGWCLCPLDSSTFVVIRMGRRRREKGCSWGNSNMETETVIHSVCKGEGSLVYCYRDFFVVGKEGGEIPLSLRGNSVITERYNESALRMRATGLGWKKSIL